MDRCNSEETVTPAVFESTEETTEDGRDFEGGDRTWYYNISTDSEEFTTETNDDNGENIHFNYERGCNHWEPLCDDNYEQSLETRDGTSIHTIKMQVY